MISARSATAVVVVIAVALWLSIPVTCPAALNPRSTSSLLASSKYSSASAHPAAAHSTEPRDVGGDENGSSNSVEDGVVAPRSHTPLLDLQSNTLPRRRGDYESHSVRKTRNELPHEYGWLFRRYVPSEFELEWYTHVGPYEASADWKPLVSKYQHLVSQMMSEMKLRVVPHDAFRNSTALEYECRRFIPAMIHAGGANVTSASCLWNETPLNSSIFSAFEYEFVCLAEPCPDAGSVLPPTAPKPGDTHVSFIEPLVGLLRHPMAFLTGARDLSWVENKAYMLVDKWALNNLHTRWRRRKKQSLFFDMGASYYLSGAGGASQPWFVGLGECMCVPFTSMSLWEAKFRNPDILWGQVPENLHPHYSWYNYPLSTDPGSWRNPLNHLLVKANREDVVFLKVDFDSPHLERRIIDTILNVTDLSERIDELFFEHHVILGGMTAIWGRHCDRSTRARGSIDLFRRLREKGIRAHSWV